MKQTMKTPSILQQRAEAHAAMKTAILDFLCGRNPERIEKPHEVTHEFWSPFTNGFRLAWWNR